MDQPESENEEKALEHEKTTLLDIFKNYTADDWKKIIEQFGETSAKLAQLRTHEKRTLSWPIFILIAVIFAAVTILAYVGKIEGHYVTSLGGVIVGYLLSYLSDTITPLPSE